MVCHGSGVSRACAQNHVNHVPSVSALPNCHKIKTIEPIVFVDVFVDDSVLCPHLLQHQVSRLIVAWKQLLEKPALSSMQPL